MTGLRGRMVLAVVATSLATLAAATLVVAPLLEHRLERDRRGELRDLARAIRPSLRPAEGDPDALAKLAARLQHRGGGRIAVIDVRGRTLADTAPEAGRAEPILREVGGRATIARAARGDVVSGVSEGRAFAVTTVGEGRRRLTLVLAKPLDDTRAAAAVVRAALPVALAAGIAVAVALAFLLSHGLMRRLRRLEADARALGSEGLSHEVEVSGRDEVATVAGALEAMRGRLAAEEQARQAFLATASHELRTPLASLQVTLELLREDALDGARSDGLMVRRADTALRQTHRLVGLATDLLELSRLDGGTPPAAEPLELGGVARALAGDLEARLIAAGRELTVDGEPAVADADPAAVARIVAILVDNAINYGSGAVSVTTETHDDGVVLAVEDEGAGVDPAECERVFARFERGRSAQGAAAGAGLGLPIARGLAEAMGGSLVLAGGPPLNRFELRLPAADHARPIAS